MEQSKYQADANLHFEIVLGVLRREQSIDFQSAQEGLPEGLADPEVLLFAASQNRILVSHDVNTMPRHFRDFMATRGSSPGVILISQEVPLQKAIEDLVLIWAASDQSDWRDRISWLPL